MTCGWLVGQSKGNDISAGGDDSAAAFSNQTGGTLIRENKVTTQHLQRAAYLYVRQSTLRQVLENTESTQRQYALRERAKTLGWSDGQVVVID